MTLAIREKFYEFAIKDRDDFIRHYDTGVRTVYCALNLGRGSFVKTITIAEPWQPQSFDNEHETVNDSAWFMTMQGTSKQYRKANSMRDYGIVPPDQAHNGHLTFLDEVQAMEYAKAARNDSDSIIRQEDIRKILRDFPDPDYDYYDD